MRIAVLISGEYREFEKAHTSWNFDLLGKVDYYFSTWSTSSSSNKRTPHGIESVTLERIQQYITLVDYRIDKKLNRMPSEMTVIVNDYGEPVAWPCAYMIDRWHAGIEMLQQVDIKYDAVILLRPDLFIQYSDAHSLLDFLSALQESCIYGCIGENYNVKETLWLQDVILIGKYDEICKLTSIPIDIQYNEQADTNIHKLLAENVIRMYDRILNISPIEKISIVRENSRHLSRPTVEQYDYYGDKFRESLNHNK